MKPYINRETYLKKMEPYIGKEMIKVIVGQRRVGKSYLLLQLRDKIRKSQKDPNIIYINKDLNEFNDIIDSHTLFNYVKSKSLSNRINYLFIDEIQTIKGFENTLKSLFAEGGYDIYCTGSNAKILSGEIATYLGGRYIEIIVYPLSYNEFLLFHKLEDNQQSLNLYMKYGGLPYLKNLPLTDEIIFDYLRNIYQAILFRDVVASFNVRNVEFLERLILYLANRTGNVISARNINKFLKSQNITISLTAILNYLEFLATAFFISRVHRADIAGKKIFEIGEKYYFNDIGLRNAIAGFRPFDMGLIIENAVFLHLKINGYKVLVGNYLKKEVDFICEKDGEKIYIQVALRISEKQTEKREFMTLLEIKDNYPKYVITLDEYTGTSYKGIEHIPLRTFLNKAI
jgi:hypothetical protein